jgi:long-chain acyl-CoA synthetase
VAAIQNVGTLFERSSRVAVVDYFGRAVPRELTFAELDDGCNAVARGLVKRGLGRGDRVAILSTNRLEVLTTLFGAMRAGCVPMPLNTKLPDDVLTFIAKDSGAKIFFVEGDLAARVPAGLHSVDFDGEGWQTFLDPGEFAAFTPSADDPCVQPYTSGSTGVPKGVLLGHAGQAWLAPTLVRARGLDPSRTLLVAAPLYHKFALLQAKSSLLAGARLVLQPPFDPRAYVAAIPEHGVTDLTGVAAMFLVILAQRGLDGVDVSTVRSVMLGASPHSQPLHDALVAAFPNAVITNNYGVTEGGPAMFGGHPRGLRRPAGAIGHPLPGVELALVGGASEDEGVLRVRSPGLMLGYHRRPDETAKRLVDGWLDTGDVCRRDADGFYYFVGRSDDMFKCGGENVFPAHVEALLERHPAVRQAAVVAVPHEIKGFVPIAFVVLEDGVSVDEESLKRFAIENGPAYAHPRRVHVRQELPVTGVFKVDRKALREEHDRTTSEGGRPRS